VNSEKQFSNFLSKYRSELLDTVESASIFSRDEIEPLLDTALPGMAEVAGLLAIHDALVSRRFDKIVVDTAPFGHTLRLFALPEHFSRFLDFLEVAGSRDRILAAHFGGTEKSSAAGFLQEWRAIVGQVQEAISHQAQFFLVSTPEKFALNESLRVTAELRASATPLEVSGVVLNRAIVRATACLVCRKKERATRTAKVLLKREFPGRTLYMAEDAGSPVVGRVALHRFGEHVFAGTTLSLQLAAPQTQIKFEKAEWPLLDRPLSMVLGKGGVGKTTISAALGFRAREEQRRPVAICSVDPAPSLDDVFQQEITDTLSPVLGDAKFRASELDAVSGFAAWVRGVKQKIDDALSSNSSGVHVDLSFERKLLGALLDIVPPGVDEVFAVFRILDLLAERSQRVIIDMAPTGHALELLRTPERMLLWSKLLLKSLAAHRRLALARDVAVEIATLGQRIRELADLLKNSKQARIWIVMLAEALPDRETERLIGDLRELGLRATTIFVNRVRFAKAAGECRRCFTARQWQLLTLAKLKRQHGRNDMYVVRDFAEEIAGKKALRSFTRELWRIA
jgi:arsenite-transporting ATPase